LSVPARTITANPKLVLDPAGTVRTLTALLHLDAAKQQSLLDAFTAKKNSFVYVARQIDPNLADTVVALRLAGVSSISEDKRVLPSGDVGRSVIGRTDPDLEGTAVWRRSTTTSSAASTVRSRRNTTESTARSPVATKRSRRSPAPTSC
jgi:cell division protein FtsI (penicillin-binding protein 3)